MMSQPSTIHQRESRQFPLKASKNQLAFKKGRKNEEKGAGGRWAWGGGGKSQFFRKGHRYFILNFHHSLNAKNIKILKLD